MHGGSVVFTRVFFPPHLSSNLSGGVFCLIFFQMFKKQAIKCAGGSLNLGLLVGKPPTLPLSYGFRCAIY